MIPKLLFANQYPATQSMLLQSKTSIGGSGTRPTDTFTRLPRTSAPAVQFCGTSLAGVKHSYTTERPYAPKSSELVPIGHALCGGEPGVSVGVNFFPRRRVEKYLSQWLEMDSPVPPAVLIDDLSKQKLSILNFYKLIIGNGQKITDNREKAKIRAASEAFLKDFKEQYTLCEQRFMRTEANDGLRLTPTDMKLIRQVMVKTGPLLFNMGHADAILHAGQVARLCGTLAQQHQATPVQIVQSILVGWLHDCKLSPDLSYDNMATHPMVSSAVANAVAFNVLDKLRDDIDASIALRKRSANQTAANTLSPFAKLGPYNTPQFIDGVIEALSVNNDSDFILTERILPALSTQPIFRSEGMRAILRNWALERLWAASEGKKPPTHPQEYDIDSWLDILDQTSLGTGIYMIPLSKARPYGFKASQLDNLNKQGIRAQISRYPQVVEELRISGKSLFHHHLEASKHAAVASLMLSQADPMLLSAHKVMVKYEVPSIALSKPDYTTLDAIKEYLDSYQDQINLSDERERVDAMLFQRALLLILLFRAQVETGYEPNWRTKDNETLAQEIERLTAILKDDNTWPDWTRTPIKDHIDIPAQPGVRGHRGDGKFKKLIETLTQDYKRSLQAYSKTIKAILHPLEDYQGLPPLESEDLETQLREASYKRARFFKPDADIFIPESNSPS